MATHDFSIEYLANSLIDRLDRRNIFPPLHNNPELFLSSVSSSLNNLSSYRPKRPPNAFLICRKNVQEESKRKGTYNMRIISKVTSILWKNATREEREVYKRLVNNVYEIHHKRTCIIYKKIAEISNSKKKRTSSNKSPMQSTSKKTPMQSTSKKSPMQSTSKKSSMQTTSKKSSMQTTSNKASMQLLSNTTSIETSRPSLTLPSLNDSIFNFNLIGNDFLLNNQSNNEDNLVSYTNFNGHGQIHNSNQYDKQNQTLTTYNNDNNNNNNNNNLVTPQNYCF
ncbi:hypothetical protein C1646_671507 [Rhizophagus diaphanus]|nr:hypothetical protein C1646_671507 [Rhizophagus diaphanus] [Rhizophagus sp. MUCL 43196]